jgi:hypothetical protein
MIGHLYQVTLGTDGRAELTAFAPIFVDDDVAHILQPPLVTGNV